MRPTAFESRATTPSGWWPEGFHIARCRKKSPPRPEPGGPGRRRAMLRVDAVGPLAALRFEGLDVVAGLFHRAGYETPDGVFQPPHLVHDLGQRSAVLALEHGDDLGRLAAFARPGAVLRLGGFLALGRALGRGGLLARVALGGRALGRLCAALGLFAGLLLGRRRFGLRGLAPPLDTLPDRS